VLLVACAAPREAAPGGSSDAATAPAAAKRITAAIRSDPAILAQARTLRSVGSLRGLGAIEELTDAGLTMVDGDRNRVPQFAEAVPSIEGPDPRTIVVTWSHPFIEANRMFSDRIAGLPLPKPARARPWSSAVSVTRLSITTERNNDVGELDHAKVSCPVRRGPTEAYSELPLDNSPAAYPPTRTSRATSFRRRRPPSRTTGASWATVWTS